MDKPVVIITGRPAWQPRADALLQGLGYQVDWYGERTGYVARLTDDHAALVLVDGDADGWAFWVTTPKVSPATRRIPVVVVAADDAVREVAAMAGADFALTPANLLDELPDLLEEHARQLSPGDAAHLATQCGEPLPEDAREAIRLFNAGHYYKQHDAFEALWMAEPGPIRDLYRAILQVGVAYYQVQRDNARGALKILLRSMQWLNVLPDVCQGVDVARLRADALRLREALEALPEGASLDALDPALLGQVYLIDERPDEDES